MLGLLLNPIVQYVGDTIAQYVFGKAADEILDSRTFRLKIRRLLKKDQKFIKEKFLDTNKPVADFEKFFFEDIFRDSAFLYPTTTFSSSIPEDKADMLWERFSSFVGKTQRSTNIEGFRKEDLCPRLIECVNYHNSLISEYILDVKDQIVIEIIQRNHLQLSEALGYIGKTLGDISELQMENVGLDYTHKQLEGILHALRMDMRHYKFLLIIYSFCSFFLCCAAFIVLPKIVDERALETIMRIFIATIFLFLILFLLMLCQVIRHEMKISDYTKNLWKIHFNGYTTLFDNVLTTQSKKF